MACALLHFSSTIIVSTILIIVLIIIMVTIENPWSRGAGVTHWQSPNFFAYYPANSSFPGILGEMMSAAFNCIGFSWIGCPAATELETVWRSSTIPR